MRMACEMTRSTQCYSVVGVGVHVSVWALCIRKLQRKVSSCTSTAGGGRIKESHHFRRQRSHTVPVSLQWISRDKYALRSAECLPLAATFPLCSSMSSCMWLVRRWARVRYALSYSTSALVCVSNFSDCRLSNASVELLKHDRKFSSAKCKSQKLNKQNR